MMSQEVSCPPRVASSASLAVSPTNTVLPGGNTNDADVLCATRIPGRLQTWKQRVMWSRVEECNLVTVVARNFKALALSSGVNRYVGLKRQFGDSTNPNADQALSETTYVSPSAVASSSRESASAPSPSLTAASSSSGESGSASVPTNAPSESSVETTHSILFASIAPGQAVSTSETDITAGQSQSSITISESSIITLQSSSFPESYSTIPPTTTSRPSFTPSETDLPDPTASISLSSSRQGPRSISSATFSPSTASSSSIWSASSSSSEMDIGGTSSFSLPPVESSVFLPPPSSVSSTMSEFTITGLPPFSTSVSEDIPSSTTSSSSADPVATTRSFSIPSSLFPAMTVDSSSLPPSTSDNSDSTSRDTSQSNRPTRTITITRVFTTTYSDGRTITLNTVVETGVLRTDTPQQLSTLGRNSGAIAGIAVSVTFAVLLVIFLLFYGCKRYRARQNMDRGSVDILARAREVWRPPLDGDDDDESYLRGHGGAGSLNRRQTLGSQSHSGEGDYIGQGGSGSSGDHLSGEGGGSGSAESANIGLAGAMHPTFGGQPYMPNMTQNYHETFVRPAPAVLSPHTSNDGHIAESASQYWWGINDPHAIYDVSRRSDSNDHDVTQMASRSAVSLTVVGGSGSSGGHGSGSADNNNRTTKAQRNSISGPRPMPKSEGRRHSSTPPSAFVTPVRESVFDCERQGQEQSDRTSVKGFLNRIRTTSRRLSTQSMATLRGTPTTKPRTISDESNFLPPPGLYSPSLLNPPITLTPTQALLRFPRGVTGNGYTNLSPPMPQMSSIGYDLHPPSFPWPSMTLPSAPSPVPTDDSSMVEGLLHPRLGALDNAQQASTASLRDHEDYTRPINGLVNNHLRSTTTFDTLNSEEGGPTISS